MVNIYELELMRGTDRVEFYKTLLYIFIIITLILIYFNIR